MYIYIYMKTYTQVCSRAHIFYVYLHNCACMCTTAMQMQMQTNIRKGLGMLGASKKYTIFTPSMSKGGDLETLAELLRDGKLSPVVKKVLFKNI